MTVEHRMMDGPILLTGPTGQVGWELWRSLACLGEILAVNRDVLDLRNGTDIRRVIRDVRPGLIVNAAAYTAVDKAEEEEALATAINGDAPGVMAEEARRLDIPIIHFSTDYVFDGQGIVEGGARRPYREDDPCAPLNAYGRSKRAGELAIEASGARHLILRTSWVYGLRGRNFLRTIQRLAAERDELRVVDDQIGSPTWARMIAEATGQIIAIVSSAGNDAFGPAAALPGGTYHLSARGETSWWGFASAIVDAHAAAAGAKLPKVTPILTSAFPLPTARPSYSVLDSGALERIFGICLPEWRTQLAMCLDESGSS